MLYNKYKEIKGVFIVFNSLIISGANLVKINEESFYGFESRTRPIGSIGVSILFDEKLIQMNNEFFSGEKPASVTNLPVDKIFIVTESPGLNKEYIKAVIDKRSKRCDLAFIWSW